MSMLDHRLDAGITECIYCGEKDCDYSCDESQAGGFNVLANWLAAMPHITCVRDIVVTIKGKRYAGAAYHDAHDAGNKMRLYLLGELPACYRRSARTAFVIDGADWYVACYMQSEETMRDPRYSSHHPHGKHFILCRWAVPDGSAIDRYEPRPYNRVAATI